jgi:zinc finger FYVE domain-containing protein 1
MQILAVSDVVLFRTRAERLHRDLFSFLGNASKAYIKHFADALKKMENDSSNSEPLNQVCNAMEITVLFLNLSIIVRIQCAIWVPL